MGISVFRGIFAIPIIYKMPVSAPVELFCLRDLRNQSASNLTRIWDWVQSMGNKYAADLNFLITSSCSEANKPLAHISFFS